MIYLSEYPSGDKVVVNPENIRLIRPMNHGQTCKIFFAHDQYVTVAADFYSIIDLLKGKNTKTDKKD